MIRTIAPGVLAFALALSVVCAQAEEDSDEPPTMNDLESVETLKAQFNADAGKRRLLLLLSPT